MNTSDLIDKIATEHGVTKASAKAIVALNSIIEAAVLGKEVNFLAFVPGKALKDRLNP